jgi:hypothetical protein
MPSLNTQIGKCLETFDNIGEWADIISFLSRLIRILEDVEAFKEEIPHKWMLAKRLCQCLNTALPTGVHSKTLELYKTLFKKMSEEMLLENLIIFTSGLFIYADNCPTMMRRSVLSILDTYIVPLTKNNSSHLEGLILCLISYLDDKAGESFELALETLTKIKSLVGEHKFVNSLFLLLKCYPKRQLILFLLLRYDFSESLNDLNSSSVNSALISCLSDTNLITVRDSLDFLIKYIPLTNEILENEGMQAIITQSFFCLSFKDLSVIRRLNQWWKTDKEVLDIKHRSKLSKALITAIKEIPPKYLSLLSAIFVSILDNSNLYHWLIPEVISTLLCKLYIFSNYVDMKGFFELVDLEYVWSPMINMLKDDLSHISAVSSSVENLLLVDPSVKETKIEELLEFITCRTNEFCHRKKYFVFKLYLIVLDSNSFQRYNQEKRSSLVSRFSNFFVQNFEDISVPVIYDIIKRIATIDVIIQNLPHKDKDLIGLSLINLFGKMEPPNEEAIKVVSDYYISSEFSKYFDDKMLKNFWKITNEQLLCMTQTIYNIWCKILYIFPTSTSVFFIDAMLSQESFGFLIYKQFLRSIPKNSLKFPPIIVLLGNYYSKGNLINLTPRFEEYYNLNLLNLIESIKHNNLDKFVFILSNISDSLSHSDNLQLLKVECEPEIVKYCSGLFDSSLCQSTFSLIECINLLLYIYLFIKKGTLLTQVNSEIFANITKHIFTIFPNIQAIVFNTISNDQCNVNQVFFSQNLIKKFNPSFNLDFIQGLFSLFFKPFIISNKNAFDTLSGTILEYIIHVSEKGELKASLQCFIKTISLSLKNIENNKNFVNELVIEHCNRIISNLIENNLNEALISELLSSIFETLLTFLSASKTFVRLKPISVKVFNYYLNKYPTLCIPVLSNLLSFDPLKNNYIQTLIFQEITELAFNPSDFLPVKIQKGEKTLGLSKIFGLLAFFMSLNLLGQNETFIIKYFATNSKELCSSGLKYIHLYPFFIKWIFYRIIVSHDQFQDILLLYAENVCLFSAKSIDKNASNLTGLDIETSFSNLLQGLIPDNDLRESFTFFYKFIFPTLKLIFTLNSDYEIVINSIVNNLILQAFKTKSITWFLVLNEIISYIEMQNFLKLWKREFWEFFIYSYEPNKIFLIDNIVNQLLPLLLKEEKLKIEDLFSTSNFGTISLFIQKENESMIKQQILRKLNLFIESSPKDYLVSQLPNIISKIQEYIKDQDSRICIYSIIISLLSKVSIDYANSLLPSLIVYIVQI